jgi:hypothetical protein
METKEIVKILEQKMAYGMFKQTIDLIKKESETNSDATHLFNKYIYPKLRQYGLKIEIKIRPMIIKLENNKSYEYRINNDIINTVLPEIIKEQKLDNLENIDYDDKIKMVENHLIKKGEIAIIKHYSLWIDNQIYHWGIKNDKEWTINSLEESDYEITKNWNRDPNNNQIYFSLRTIDEINQWISEWKNTHTYDLEKCNSQTFVKELVSYLHLY